MILSSRRLFLLFCFFVLAAVSMPFSSSRAGLSEPAPRSKDIENLLAQLFKAESSQQLQTILSDNRHLVSPELIEAISNSEFIDPVPGNSVPPKAEMLNQMLLGLSQQQNHKKGIAVAISHLGVIHRKREQYDLAIRYFNQSLPVFQKIGDREWLGRVHRYFIRAYYGQGDFSSALDHARQDFDLARQAGEPYAIARAHFNLGVACEELELYQQAIEHYETAFSVNQTVANPPPKANVAGLTEDILRRAARTRFAVGDIQGSLEHYSRLVAIGRQSNGQKDLAEYLNLLATAQHELGDLKAAEQSCNESLAISGKSAPKAVRLQTYRLLAYIHSDLKNHAVAIEFIENAKAISKGSNDRTLENLHLAEGVIYHAAGQIERARSAFDQAIKLIEERQAKTPANLEGGPLAVSFQYAPYGRMIALLMSQGLSLEALNYSERAKSRYLFDLLNNPNLKGRFAEASMLEEQRQLINQIPGLEIQIAAVSYAAQPDIAKLARLQTQIRQARESLKTVESTIKSSAIAIAERRPQKLNLTKEDLSELLPDDKTAIIQFATGKTQTFLFVATKTAYGVDLQSYPVKLGKHELLKEVMSFRRLIEKQNQTNHLDLAARKLHDDLLGDAQTQLQSVNSLIIVPDGPLWELPFQALKTQNDRYLIERHAIAYAPSLNVLRMFPLRQAGKINSQSSNRLLAFGNPALKKSGSRASSARLMYQSGGPLPEAEKLVLQISKMYGAQKSLTLIGGNATEDKFKSLSPGYSIIHLAAHGKFNDLEPMRSRIILSQTGNKPGEDGYLEACEIAKLKLNADLVILSACETGRGQVRAGEGIIGLPWAIFVAGCPTAVVSQWNVEAQSTSELMFALHKELNRSDKHVSKSEAMRQAALSLINGSNKDLNHPFYWAGFVVMGKAD